MNSAVRYAQVSALTSFELVVARFCLSSRDLYCVPSGSEGSAVPSSRETRSFGEQRTAGPSAPAEAVGRDDNKEKLKPSVGLKSARSTPQKIMPCTEHGCPVLFALFWAKGWETRVTVSRTLPAVPGAPAIPAWKRFLAPPRSGAAAFETPKPGSSACLAGCDNRGD